MPIETLTKSVAKRVHFMLSQHPKKPFQLFRYTVDTTQGIDIIQRYDLDAGKWVKHDNDLIRDNFFGYRYDLTNIAPPEDDAEVKEIAMRGWKAKRFADGTATTTET